MLQIKKMAYLLLLFVTVLSHAQPLVISGPSVFAPSRLGKVQLSHDDDGFSVVRNGIVHRVNSYDVDPLLGKANRTQLAAFLKCGYVSVSECGEGFALKANVRGLGGGAGGATAGFWIGRGLVYGLSYGAIGIVSALSGPAAPWTFATLSATLAPSIEGAAQVGQLAGGIAGAVATGPV